MRESHPERQEVKFQDGRFSPGVHDNFAAPTKPPTTLEQDSAHTRKEQVQLLTSKRSYPMLNRSSEAALKIMGTFVADSAPPEQPMLRWLQDECRHGKFAQDVRDFAEKQEEQLIPERVRVLRLSEASVVLAIPTKVFDHESRDAVEVEVYLELNPCTRETTRRLLA
jgi:hypothetical protein